VGAVTRGTLGPVAPTPRQIARRDRAEALIALVAPVLDLVLAVGDRISRITGPPDERYPVPAAGEPPELEPPARDA
jgi:hypothetical protein